MADRFESPKHSPGKKRKTKTKWRPLNQTEVSGTPATNNVAEVAKKSTVIVAKEKTIQNHAPPLMANAWSSGQVPSTIIANSSSLKKNTESWPVLGNQPQNTGKSTDVEGASVQVSSVADGSDKATEINQPTTAPVNGNAGQESAAQSEDRSQGTRHRRQPDYGSESADHHGRQNVANPVQSDSLVRLSKTLSYILRHGAENMGLTFLQGGFLYVDDVLALDQLRRFTLNNIIEVVETNDKQRFHIQRDSVTNRLMIRANQGHSVAVEGLALTPITDGSQYPDAIHGTYHKNWQNIKTEGLSRMGRTHIHLATGEPGRDKVISGMRSTCDVIIELDVAAAVNDGIEFFLSANNVILSPGNEDGVIPPQYFKRVITRKTREPLDF